jgi:aspartate-semialdehyde dehydrogenase
MIVFSCPACAGGREAEPLFAQAGYAVCSKFLCFRLDADVRVIIPEVNADHLVLLKRQKEQRGWEGLLVTSPNCTTNRIAIPLKPIDMAFGLKKVMAVSMQAVSGAGYPGSLTWISRITSFLSLMGEEEKIESESRALLGRMAGSNAWMRTSLSVHRRTVVAVSEGHYYLPLFGIGRKSGDRCCAGCACAISALPFTAHLPSMPLFPI